MDGDSLLPDELRGHGIQGKIDIRLPSGGEHGTGCGVEPPFWLAIFRLKARLTVGREERGIRNRVTLVAQELNSRNEANGHVGELRLDAIEYGNDVGRFARV